MPCVGGVGLWNWCASFCTAGCSAGLLSRYSLPGEGSAFKQIKASIQATQVRCSAKASKAPLMVEASLWAQMSVDLLASTIARQCSAQASWLCSCTWGRSCFGGLGHVTLLPYPQRVYYPFSVVTMQLLSCPTEVSRSMACPLPSCPPLSTILL